MSGQEDSTEGKNEGRALFMIGRDYWGERQRKKLLERERKKERSIKK